jgi:hypothetical protein
VLNLLSEVAAERLLICVAVRSGDSHAAARALERLAETAQAGGTDFGLGSRRAAAPWSASRWRPKAFIARRPSGSAAQGIAQSWLARICCTASGCAAKAGDWMPVTNCALPTACSPRSAWRRSPIVPAGS